MQNEKATFRKEAVENFFTSGNKPFEVQSPPSFTTYTLTALAFLSFAIAALNLIHLPVHIKATGEVLAGKDYHQITVPDPGMNAVNIMVSEGENITRGQALIKLMDRDQNKTDNDIADITIQIDTLQSHFSEMDASFASNIANIERQQVHQNRIIKQAQKNLLVEKDILTRYTQSAQTGSIAMRDVEAQKRIVNGMESTLIREQAALYAINMQQNNISDAYHHEKEGNTEKLQRHLTKLDYLQKGITLISPCDCTVDNILTDTNTPVSAGQSVLTLSTSRDTSEVILYIPANQYRTLQEGMLIRLNVEAYPSATHGATTATIKSVSSLPVPSKMLNNTSHNLSQGAYFVVKASIQQSPSEVKLTTGMTINSDIVIDEKSLFSTFFNFGHAH